MSGEVIVDGATYRWFLEEDDRARDMTVAATVVFGPPTIVVQGDDVLLSFEWSRPGATEPGWWRISSTVPEIVERAIRIAKARGFTAADRLVAIEGPTPTVFDELAIARAALGRWPRDLTVAMLAIGCAHGHEREAIDDWVASHADVLVEARDWLAALLEIDGTSEIVFRYRSAVAFLVEMTARLNVELALSTTASDQGLRGRRPVRAHPWGIPESHWWWTG